MDVDPVIACGIVGNIGQFWLKEQFTDLQINIDEEMFQCHRLILCACSELFQVLLHSEVKCEIEHPVKEVTVRGISTEIFRLIINAIYKGEDGLNTENMIVFWHAAHKLQIPVLVSKCEKFISGHITRENCFEIYSSTLLLESENMIKVVHEFMAENFEYFSKCSRFMQLPSKTLHDILSSENLKVASANVLVEFILKWVNHEPCESNAETVCEADRREVQDINSFSGLSLDHSADVISDTKGCVEVILQQPSATDLESCLRAHCLTETTVAGKEALGKLLQLVRLSEASKDCLEMLADTDMIMGVKETRDLVKQALEANIKVQKSVVKKVLPTNSNMTSAVVPVNCEYVTVFVFKNKIYAYSVDRNKLFDLMPEQFFVNLFSIFTFNNCIFVTFSYQKFFYTRFASFPFSDKDIKEFKTIGSSFIVDDFCYAFTDDSLFRKRFNDGMCDWFPLIQFKQKSDSVLVNIFKGNIIFYRSDFSGSHVYCFNIETRRFWSILKSSYLLRIVSFIHNDQLYVLRDNGCIWNMTEHTDSPRTETVNADSPHVEECKLWDIYCYNIVGAVVYADSLLIFTDLNWLAPSIKYKNMIPGVSEVRLIHLNAAAKCYPLVVPTTMLVKEV